MKGRSACVVRRIARGYCERERPRLFPFDDIPGSKRSRRRDRLGPGVHESLRRSLEGRRTASRGALDGITNVRVLVYEDIATTCNRAEVRRLYGDEARGRRLACRRARERRRRAGSRVHEARCGGTLAGVTVMVTDSGDDGGGDEAVFINVAGTIRARAARPGSPSTIGMNGMFNMMPGVAGVSGAAARKGPQGLSLRNWDTCSVCDELVAQTTTARTAVIGSVFPAHQCVPRRCNRLARNLLYWDGRLRPVVNTPATSLQVGTSGRAQPSFFSRRSRITDTRRIT